MFKRNLFICTIVLDIVIKNCLFDSDEPLLLDGCERVVTGIKCGRSGGEGGHGFGEMSSMASLVMYACRMRRMKLKKNLGLGPIPKLSLGADRINHLIHYISIIRTKMGLCASSTTTTSSTTITTPSTTGRGEESKRWERNDPEVETLQRSSHYLDGVASSTSSTVSSTTTTTTSSTAYTKPYLEAFPKHAKFFEEGTKWYKMGKGKRTAAEKHNAIYEQHKEKMEDAKEMSSTKKRSISHQLSVEDHHVTTPLRSSTSSSSVTIHSVETTGSSYSSSDSSSDSDDDDEMVLEVEKLLFCLFGFFFVLSLLFFSSSC